MAKAKQQKLKMSNKVFRWLVIPIIVLLTVLGLAVNIAAIQFKAVIDGQLGSGSLQVKHATEAAKQWDSQYNKATTNSLADAKKSSDTLAEEVSNEGIVLLKNNGVLPLEEKTTVTPYGYGYLNPVFSGTGAAASKDSTMVTPEEALSKYFTLNKKSIEVMEKAESRYPDAAEGTPALDFDRNSLQAIMDKGESAKIHEYPVAVYEQIGSSAQGNAGIVFIRRNGSEGMDKRYYGYNDGTPHYLAFTQAEKEMIAQAKKQCEHVVVVLNTSNPMELSPIIQGEFEADAIIWMGTAGSRGFASLGNILAGKVNPSGRLSDTYATDFTKDPTFANFGEYHYSNATVTDTQLIGNFIPEAAFGTIQRPFVDYEEGIYVGYRYYETADYEDSAFDYGQLDNKGGVVTLGAVAYPFGYGLSYTNFNQSLDEVSVHDGTVQTKVTVTNTGKTAGKNVVQMYYSAPYTQYDREHKVEKSVTNLAAFTKTKTLEPGEAQTVTLQWNLDDMASYDMHHKNVDGTEGAYMLEAGDYQIRLQNDSHSIIAQQVTHVDTDTWYEGNNPVSSERDVQAALDNQGETTDISENGEFVASHNEFDELTSYMEQSGITQLSRSDWKGTFPTAPENREEEAPQEALDAFARFDSFDPEKDPVLGNNQQSAIFSASMPKSGEKHSLSLIDLRNAAYNDPRWETLLDQIDWNKDKTDIQQLLFMAAYQTHSLVSIGKPTTSDKDGVMGWSIDGASSWPSATVLATTWNTDLVEKVGESIGEEALHAGINGWYAPAVNTHRSPFAGRNYEYYSEDGVLAGGIAAAAISGAGNKGVFSYLKHFALNDQETYRSAYLSTWANEQAVREIYLKPFQLALRDARSKETYLDNDGTKQTHIIRSATAMMSSQNAIGGVIGFGHFGLLTKVLRGEWNFHGSVVTDLFMESLPQQRDLTVRAGSDMYMIQVPGFNALDYDSATARTAMRKAIHNIAYMTVHSNAMNGITPGATITMSMSPWMRWLIVADAIFAAIVALLIAWIVLRSKAEKKHPERFKNKKRSKNK